MLFVVRDRRTLVNVVAHPDDDAYGGAGTVGLHADDPAFRFVLVHATDGEGGSIREGFPATRETLGAIRRKEDEAAWRAVGRPPDRHEWLGHPDHVTIGAATDAAFHRARAGASGGFKRLIHSGIPQSVFERWNSQRAAKGLMVFDPSQMYHMRGIPDEQIDITVDCRAVASRTVAGLREHRSQHHAIIDDPDDTYTWERVVSREWWVVAWPPRPESAPMLTDVFEDL